MGQSIRKVGNCKNFVYVVIRIVVITTL